jgi:hypothetical protein
MTTPNDPSQPQQGLTPDGLVNQLFDVILMQNPTDPRLAARHVIEFLSGALFYAVTSNKGDVVVFLTETLSTVITAASPDEASRKEMLKHVGDMFLAAANAPPIPAAAGKPVASKP